MAEDSLEEALQRADSWAVTRQLVLGALEIELTLRQRGLSSLALHARCRTFRSSSIIVATHSVSAPMAALQSAHAGA